MPTTERTEIEQPTDLTDFSASRLKLAGQCGLAFEYQYVRQLPAPYDRGASLLGLALHYGHEEWYGPPADGDAFKERDLPAIVGRQWERLLPPVIWQHVQELIELQETTSALASFIQAMRPEIRAPVQTQQYLTHPAVKEFTDKRGEMLEFCDKLDSVKWPKDEDPYKAYTLSTQWAANIQQRWQHLERPLAVELPFRIQFEGFNIRGRIDRVVRSLVQGGVPGEARVRMTDIKTTRNALTQMDAFLQSWIYDEAIRQNAELPNVDDIDFYLARRDCYQRGQIDRPRHDRLASRILNGRARQIVMGQFEPSYGHWCERCDFNDLCSTEISLWQGDGIVIDLHEKLPQA